MAIRQVWVASLLRGTAKAIERAERDVFLICQVAGEGPQLLVGQIYELGEITIPDQSRGGSLSLVGPAYTLQNFDIWTDDLGINHYLFSPGELRYFSTNDNLVITMENGAVIEKPLGTNGSFMLADPRWYLDTNTGTLVINLMNLSSGAGTDQQLSQTGVGTVRMRLLNANVTAYNPGGMPVPINVRYTPDPKNATPEGYGFAWRNYFINPNNFDGGMTCTGEPIKGEPVTCRKPGIRNIIIKEYDVIIESL